MLKTAQDLLKIVGKSRERTLYVFNLDHLDVFRQLTFEEFLYRNVTPNSPNSAFFLVNNHQFDRAVIFGLSGNPSEFIKDFDFCKKNNIKLIKRFSGGGTVLIDENSLTSSLIATHGFSPGLKANEICKWTFDNIYNPCKLFKNNFNLVDGDYVMKTSNSLNNIQNIQNIQNNQNEDYDYDEGNQKFMYYKVGGNAQAFSKDSFVHHTSFIWNVSPLIERVLHIPKKAPKYRDNRDHSSFLESVSKVLKNPSLDKNSFANSLRESVAKTTSTSTETETPKTNQSTEKSTTPTHNQTHFHFKYFSKSQTTNNIPNEVQLFDDSFVDSCINSLERSNTTLLSY